MKIRENTSKYVKIRENTRKYVQIRENTKPSGVLNLVSKLVGRKAHFFGKLDAFLLQLVRALSQASRFMLFYLR